MILMDNVAFAYDRTRPLFCGLNLEIGSGLTLVLGPNGSGKSTLLKLAAGVEPPDHGTVRVDGFDLWRDEVAARRALAYVPDQPDLTPFATIRDILILVADLRGEPRRAVEDTLAAVGLDRLADRSVRELSLGQRRRATFAAAFLGRPSHLLLDEPLEAMDRGMREAILDWIGRRVGEGASAVVVSHETAPFAALAARAVGLNRGAVLPALELPAETAARMACLDRLARGFDPRISAESAS